MFVSRILLAVALLALPVQAFATDDEVVAATPRAKLPTGTELTAKSDTPTEAAKPLTTEEQIARWLADAQPAPRQRSSGVSYDGDSSGGPRKVHGGAGVSIGTGGYRSGYVYGQFPIGDNGTLGIAVSQTDFGKNGGFGYYGYDDYGYGAPYGGYGYGDFGHGYRHRRGGSTQSFGLSLDMSDGQHNASDTPDGCAPGFRDDGRYIEPLWVSKLHDGKPCDASEEP